MLLFPHCVWNHLVCVTDSGKVVFFPSSPTSLVVWLGSSVRCTPPFFCVAAYLGTCGLLNDQHAKWSSPRVVGDSQAG